MVIIVTVHQSHNLKNQKTNSIIFIVILCRRLTIFQKQINISNKNFISACAPSGVIPEKGLVVQQTGQFMVERLVKIPEDVPGSRKHRTKTPVFLPPSVRHRLFGQCCLHLLWQRTYKKSKTMHNQPVKMDFISLTKTKSLWLMFL